MTKQSLRRIRLSGSELLRHLLDWDAFRIAQLLETQAFLRHCRKSGVEIRLDVLETLEKKGLFIPLARVHYPVHKRKLRRLENGRFEEVGWLEDGESWDGRVEIHYSRPDFGFNDMKAWFEEGILCSADEEGFESRKYFFDPEGGQRAGNYYSLFQTYTLAYQLRSTTFPLSLATVSDFSDKDFLDLGRKLGELAKGRCDNRSRLCNPRFDAVLLAQAIATRYYPQARTDGRTIQTPGEWDWHGLSRRWSAERVVEILGLTSADIRHHYDSIDLAIAHDDPLANWDDLLGFVARSQRERLAGKAQHGQTLRTMRNMFALLYEDLTGKTIEPRRGSLQQLYFLNDGSQLARADSDRTARVSHDADLLEFVANRYGINPQPSMVLFVEGHGEQTAIPYIAEQVFGLPLAVLGIELRNLRGVHGFIGKKRDRYGALERAIEELHWRQTVAFVILDREGTGITKLREDLSQKASREFPARTVTRREYIHIWKESFEFDNFSNLEIAEAMSAVSREREHFSEADIQAARSQFGTQGNPLGATFKERLRYGLPKRELLETLTKNLRATDERPIVVLMGEIIKIAARNHKPTHVDLWFDNQESGFLGHPVSGDDKTAAKFKALARLQEHLE